jgi:hypothetical protein
MPISLAVLLLAGCVTTTEKQLLQSQIDLHNRAIAQSQRTLAQLKNDAGGPGSYDAKAFISTTVVNKALDALGGITFPIPGIANATGRLNQVQLLRYGTVPAILLDAEAKKSDLTIKIKATAVLIPTDPPGDLKLSILSFVPDVQWSWIDFTKSQFIRELLAVQASNLTERMPLIHLPTKGTVALGGPAMDQEITFQLTPNPSYMTMHIHIPATEWDPTYQNVRYYFLGDGLYVFGDLK